MVFTVRPIVSCPAAVRPVPRAVVARASRVAEPAVLTVKGIDGAEVGSAELALKVAGRNTARHVVHRYLVMVRQNARSGNAHTKTRAEVRGGGKKPIAQKGTGNARRGSTRSPLIKGGGVSFGPRTKDWHINMNKKERRLALATAFQSAASDMTVVDSITGKMPDRKTKSLVTAISKMGIDVMSTHTLIVTAEENSEVSIAGKNVRKLQVNTAKALKMYDVLRADKIIVEQGALDHINSFYQ